MIDGNEVKSIGYGTFWLCSDDFTIKCYENSYAYDYAIANDIPVILKSKHEHYIVTDPAVAPNCTKTGLTKGSHCSECNEVIVEQKVVPSTGHTYKKTTTKAKPGTNGAVVKTCTVCKDEVTVSTIYAPKTIALSVASYKYNGKQRKPVVTVKDGKGNVIASSNYTVTYTNNINAGNTKTKPTVKVTFKGSKYTGSLSRTFTINKATNKLTGAAVYTKTASIKAQSFKLNMKATGGKITYKSDNKNVKADSTGKVTIAKNFSGKAVITVTAGNNNYKTATKKVTITVKPAAVTLKSVKNTTVKNASKGKFTITWNKLSYATGYQIQYSANSSFKSGNKTVNVKGASTVSKAITGLAKNKTYYVRIRTYKTIAGKNVFSAWSAKKSVKIK